jgi:hypothetical protein
MVVRADNLDPTNPIPSLRHCQDVGNLNVPPGGDESRLGREAFQQIGGLGRGFIRKQPRHGHRAIDNERGAHLRPSLISSLIVVPPRVN